MAWSVNIVLLLLSLHDILTNIRTDGRPNNAAQSSDARLERSVIGGLKLIQEFIAPEVIITQRQEWENPFFWNGLHFHKIGSETPHIALPSASRNLMWIASLRSHALRCKYHVYDTPLASSVYKPLI